MYHYFVFSAGTQLNFISSRLIVGVVFSLGLLALISFVFIMWEEFSKKDKEEKV